MLYTNDSYTHRHCWQESSLLVVLTVVTWEEKQDRKHEKTSTHQTFNPDSKAIEQLIQSDLSLHVGE